MINVPVYVVNLAHRQDRLESVLCQLRMLNFNLDLVEVIEAQYSPRNGSLGCAASHAFALATFLFRSDADYCLIIEDDFQIAEAGCLGSVERVKAMLLSDLAWDVVLLASNHCIPVNSTELAGLFRVVNSLTTSAYFVRRRYAPSLVRLFYQSENLISSSLFNLDARLQKHFFAPDVLWKNEQIFHQYFAFIPAISVQAESFSDIENSVVNYGA